MQLIQILNVYLFCNSITTKESLSDPSYTGTKHLQNLSLCETFQNKTWFSPFAPLEIHNVHKQQFREFDSECHGVSRVFLLARYLTKDDKTVAKAGKINGLPLWPNSGLVGKEWEIEAALGSETYM